jgi:hypothetical protein
LTLGTAFDKPLKNSLDKLVSLKNLTIHIDKNTKSKHILDELKRKGVNIINI